MSDTVKKIRGFILDNFLFSDDEQELKNDDSFLEKGIIDSTGMLEVISFVENEFGIKVDDDELIPDNLDSVNNLNDYIIRKTGKDISKAAPY
jgi:acyl carrier protein